MIEKTECWNAILFPPARGPSPPREGGEGLVLRLELHGRQKDAIPNFSERSLPAGKNVSSSTGKASWRVGIMEGDPWGSPCAPHRVW